MSDNQGISPTMRAVLKMQEIIDEDYRMNLKLDNLKKVSTEIEKAFEENTKKANKEINKTIKKTN